MRKELAPIALFVYNRPRHTERTLKALSKNVLAEHSTLYIFADGPKKDASVDSLAAINETRALLSSQQWCGEVILIFSELNKGLAKSIIAGVAQVLEKHDRLIVLEDDLITSIGFLKYMNDALTVYENEPSIMHVSGYMYPVSDNVQNGTVFLRILSCWGWATWKRAWKFYCGDVELPLRLLDSKLKKKRFNILGNAPFYDQLVANQNGSINSWAVKWYASWFFRDGISLFPETTLVVNIGHDGSGVHCVQDNQYEPNFVADTITVRKQRIVESSKYRRLIDNFYKTHQEPRTPLTVERIIYILKRSIYNLARDLGMLTIIALNTLV